VSPGYLQRLRASRKPPFRIFFATDVHGSDRCFRKFIAAASAYEADALILGGDVAGKAMVPIVDEGGARFSYSFQGATRTVGLGELEEVKERMGFNGFYPRVTDASDLERMNEDADYVAGLFEEAIAQQTRAWCDVAADRLPEGVRCIITPGNDDPRVIDEVLVAAPRIECPELQTVELGPIWLSSCGNTNRTPWDTDREYDEPELARQIAEMVEPFADGRALIFNFHCPPYDTGLDVAPRLDADFRPVLDRGTPVEIPVGSSAVREAIERYRPVAGLHGHIHESANACALGRSWCFNPGSDYSSGVLKGLILDLEDNGDVRSHLFTHG
jgi:Icc-related predicted phosphoesterase